MMKKITSLLAVCFLLVSNVLADGAPKAQGGSLLSMLPMLILLVGFMYFMVIRPQTKRAKEHKNLMGNLQVGDEVATIGGILGTIDKIADNFIILVVADNSKVTIQRGAVATILPRGTIKGITSK
jgi:preprotein translocase subunit YajC